MNQLRILTSEIILPVCSAPIKKGAVAISGKRIVATGRSYSIRNKFPGADVTELGDCVILPGLVNTHAHLELSYLKDTLPEKRVFFEWILDLIDKRRELGTTGLKKAAHTALNSAIRSGTTCLADISGTGLVVDSLRRSGIRARVYHEIIGLDPRSFETVIEHLENRLAKFDSLPGRIDQGVSPHSSYSVTSSILSQIQSICSDDTLPLSIHLSESIDESHHISGRKSDVDVYMKYTGWHKHRPNRSRSPVQLAKEHGILNNALVAHAVHVGKSDINILKRHGASVSHCPRSNHLLSVGRAPVRAMLDSGVNVALGTDSLASNLDLDMWEEMRFAYLVNDIPAEVAIRMATINGAIALGLDHAIGSIEEGKEADLIAVRMPEGCPASPYPVLVKHAKGSDVVMTMVQGKVIHKSGGVDI